MAEFDTTGRPLFLLVSNGLLNAAGVLEDVASQQIVGSIQGLEAKVFFWGHIHFGE